MVLAIFATWSYLTLGGRSQVPINEEKLAEEVRERIAKNAPEIESEVKSVVAELAPPLGIAISQQFKEDRDRYINTLRTEGGKFAENADDIFIDALKAEYGDFLRAHRQVLADEFPDHADEESLDRLIAEFEKVGGRLIDRYRVKQFAEQAQRTQASWENIQPLETPEPGEPSLETQLRDYAVDWSVLAFTQEAEEAVLD
ncbi:hypothetical protein Pan97_47870 [Bremerella volcania]|uniref:Uncharacterized protein n=2 Tax=Bremerella volcania TaxID=2527984 RepID=A0A518CEQ9_9BACT|nr:hypothetical protein Pan97_47870 [Bremerella volcania]